MSTTNSLFSDFLILGFPYSSSSIILKQLYLLEIPFQDLSSPNFEILDHYSPSTNKNLPSYLQNIHMVYYFIHYFRCVLSLLLQFTISN